jgi:hypothetical protein
LLYQFHPAFLRAAIRTGVVGDGFAGAKSFRWQPVRRNHIRRFGRNPSLAARRIPKIHIEGISTRNRSFPELKTRIFRIVISMPQTSPP